MFGWFKRLFRKSFEKTDYNVDVDYRYMEEFSERGLLPVEILKGKFSGYILVVTALRVIDDAGRVEFDYDLIIDPVGDGKIEELDTAVSLILVNTLTKSYDNLQQLKNEVLRDDENGLDYSEEFTPQRTIQSKSPTISKK